MRFFSFFRTIFGLPIPKLLIDCVSSIVQGAHLLFRLFCVFLIFPFTRLVHVWSGFAAVGYAVRPYQIVRTRNR